MGRPCYFNPLEGCWLHLASTILDLPKPVKVLDRALVHAHRCQSRREYAFPKRAFDEVMRPSLVGQVITHAGEASEQYDISSTHRIGAVALSVPRPIHTRTSRP